MRASAATPDYDARRRTPNHSHGSTAKPMCEVSYHGNFSSGNHGVGQEPPSAGFLLVQHVLELLLGIAFESHKFETESLPFFPPDDRKGNDN